MTFNQSRHNYERKLRAEFPDLDIQIMPRHWPWERVRPNVLIEGRIYSFWTWKGLFVRWRTPYGLWTCADGREVLFNRDYKPIWERSSGEIKHANPNEWVQFTDQRSFHGGSDNLKPAVLKRLEQVLADFKAGKDVRRYLIPGLSLRPIGYRGAA
jgi:hypothetical protein